MGLARTIIIGLLVVLLAVDLAAANAVVAADRTVLNPDFVTTTLEDEGAYEEIEPLVIEELPIDELEAGGNDTPPLPVEPDAVIRAALDAEYIRSQVEPNIERTYAYLHGNAETLDLVVDLEPAKTAIADAVETELQNATAGELITSFGGDEESLTVEASGFTLDLQTVGEMAEDESVFEAEREELRTEIRERVIASLVDDAFTNASNDQLLGLVIDDYDPSAYTEAEKEQLVDDNEAEIRAALRDRIEAEAAGEISAEVDRRLADARESVRAEASAVVDEALGDVDPAVADPAEELLLVAVDGYVADISHDEFSAEFEAAGDDLAAGAATLLENELDEQVPDRLDLTEELDPSATESLETLRRAVGIIDLLTLVLPLVGLGIVGAIYLVSRSVATTAIGAGVGLGIGGLPALVGASLVPGQLQRVSTTSEAPQAVTELVLVITGRVVDALVLQSAVVVVLGAVLLGIGLALRFDVIDIPELQRSE